MSFAAHLERYFPDGHHAVIAPLRSEVEERLPGFRVWRIAPDADGEPWAYATCGAAAEGGEGAEYVLLAPASDPRIVEMLGALATVNAGAEEGLGVGSIIALGRPWTVNSFANHLLVLPPYAFDPGFALYEDGERRVVVLWLVPITEAEAQFAREEGHEALERLIERGRANLANPRRPSII